MRNLPTAMRGVSVLGRRFFPIQPRSKWLQPRPKPWFQPCQRPCITGTQLSHAWIPNPQALSDNKCVLFWPAKLGDNLLHNSWWLIHISKSKVYVPNHHNILFQRASHVITTGKIPVPDLKDKKTHQVCMWVWGEKKTLACTSQASSWNEIISTVYYLPGFTFKALVKLLPFKITIIGNGMQPQSESSQRCPAY